MKRFLLTIFPFLFSSIYPSILMADIANFDLDGRIYTKYLYQNDDSQGLMYLGNPFWPENFSGNNGIGSEFELVIRGDVSQFVKAGVRLKSRFGSVWQDWWENGDLKETAIDDISGADTSGESLGMNHAEYIKLRGYWVRIVPPLKTIKWFHVGSSDLSYYNPWTIGKIRYTDRDNAKGFFIQGGDSRGLFLFHLSAIAMPKLWVGPNWSTGLGDNALNNPLITKDWAYATKLEWLPSSLFKGAFITTLTNDLEVNIYDPDAIGTENPEGEKDYAVDLDTRYRNLNSTIELNLNPIWYLRANILGGYSYSNINEEYAYNGVKYNQGVYPMIYGKAEDLSFKVRVELLDPLSKGLNLKLEYFNIGDEWTSTFGARREADVLLTDGFIEGGQLPTLNLANEFIDFDEPWYESCIGWHGVTGLFEIFRGGTSFETEYTYIGYNSNMQGRDVENRYPDFLWTDGYTDTDLYDYANVSDRGRDLRSVYRENQQRFTHIGVIRGRHFFYLGRGFEMTYKFKYIHDEDERDLSLDIDNYVGDIYQIRLSFAYQMTDELKMELGDQYDKWIELERSGTEAAGYDDYLTEKNKLFGIVYYDFAGFKLKYIMEWILKDQFRETADDQHWNVIRAKASMEVAW